MLSVAVISNAQTVTVKDSLTNRPLPSVELISRKPEAYSITNAHGQAGVAAFDHSKKIEIRGEGYEPKSISYEEIGLKDFEVLLIASNLTLSEVVVSGSRWRQFTDNFPSKIITISSKEIALQNPQTAADLLGISGKVYIQKSQQGGGSPMIRGFATNRLLYTVDGVRMNTAIFRGGNIQNVINIDPFATEKTEVLFGPGSVIYGSDAIGGVMSFQTLTPQFSLQKEPIVNGKAIARYSSASKEKTGHFDINAGWKKFAFVTSFSTWDFDHLRQGKHGPDDYLKTFYAKRVDDEDKVISQDDPLLQRPSAYSQTNLMQKVRFKPNDHWDFQYGFHYSVTSTYGRYDRHNRMRNGLPRYAEWNYGPQKWMMNNLNILYSKSTFFYDRLVLRLAQQSFEESRIDRSLNNKNRNTQTENVEAWSANADFRKSTGSNNNFMYGLEYIFNDVRSKGNITDITTGIQVTGPSRYPKSNWSSLASYINDEFLLSEKISLQAGLRYNQFLLDANFSNNLLFYPFPFTSAKINKGSLTGSVGGVFRPAPDWIISTNFATAFRSPNVDDIGKIFDSEPGSVTVPNPNLMAEYAYNFDLDIAKKFTNAVNIDVTAFYTILDNALVRRNFKFNGKDSIMYDGEISGVQAMQNAAVANVYGLQGGLKINLGHGFSFSSDINYQAGEEELDDGSTSPSRHAAPLFGISRVNYKSNQLSLELYSSYQGKRKFEDLAMEERSKDEIYAKDATGNNYSPSWCTLNFKSMFALSNIVSLNAGIENITDIRYRPYSSGISAPGRNFIFSMRVTF
jgi:hemoglobin/transferrin/lactoferrin receptor protein